MRLSTYVRLHVLATLWGATAAAQGDTTQSLRLPRIFGDAMVLQRQTGLPVWGWSAPRQTVSVTLAGATRRATADASGSWRVTLPPQGPGGPYQLVVRAGSDSILIRDVLIGDVWVASGQSNMEWPLATTNDAASVIASTHDPRIRHFKVPTSFAQRPERDLAGGQWSAADRQHVGSFSAVAYYFARDLRKSIDVPIGIINTTWGGSRIETWMSRAALGMDSARWAAVWREEESAQRRFAENLRAKIGDVPKTDPGLVDGRAVWADPALDESGWKSIPVPSLWEQAGYDGMDGIAWYRVSFDLTAEEAARGAKLGLAAIDDADVTWVNGVEVGRTNGYNLPRAYDVPASALHAGRNVVAVRVEDTGGGGGIYGDSAAVFLEVGGARRPLGSGWKFRVGTASMQPDGQHINKVPTVLYNKMVHPLLGFPIKGVIWYQGESNADSAADARKYEALFKTMITSWRREWHAGEFPFLWVQLANFMAPDSQPPAQSAWAILRDAQSAALALPKTGQAVITDIGDAQDIHPRNKRDVGARLALAARQVAYGQPVEHVGPTHRAHVVRGNEMVLRFDHVGGGLVSRANGGAVGGFAIAGSDQRFVWADARIEGNTVIVSSPQVAAPVAVRYAWGNNPTRASLYSREGLPAVPFRTDTW
ncbi:MAG TPA: sialate O-acetylesterase [Gemmatimonadaceae bacterium]|nr:sialate O-acetylesterase [Gemmatimonadaceae bacterium]